MRVRTNVHDRFESRPILSEAQPHHRTRSVLSVWSVREILNVPESLLYEPLAIAHRVWGPDKAILSTQRNIPFPRVFLCGFAVIQGRPYGLQSTGFSGAPEV